MGRMTDAKTEAIPAATPANGRAAEPMAPEQELLLVGRVVGVQGLKGELRINPMSDFPERFTRPGRRWLQRRGEPPQSLELLAGRQLPGRELYVVRFAGVDDRSAAEALVGRDLLVPATDRPKLANGEFHLLDLVGLEVRLEADGAVIGRVSDLIHAGNDLLEVELSEGGRRLLIPFVEPIVPRVELAEGWLSLTPPPGLLELAEG
jgi:16S rRNA processing protein RimM